MHRNKWVKVLTNLDVAIAAVALIVLTLMTSVGVFMRYVAKNPILWIEEIQAFCQVWMVFLGGSVAFRMGSHVAIEMVVDVMPERMQRIVGYVIDLIVLLVLAYLCLQCRGYIEQVFGKSGRPTAILRIPYVYVYGVAPYGCVLMLISYFAAKYIPGIAEESDEDQAGEVEHK